MSAISYDKRKWTAEEYLTFERDSLEKHELIDGRLRQYTPVSLNHIVIVGNTAVNLHQQLRKQPWEVLASQMRTKTSTENYFYPDVLVVSNKPTFEDKQQDILLNPTVIIEVLMPLSEQYDRNTKFRKYRHIPTFGEYVLIAQDEIRVERYLRQGNNWLLTDFIAPDAVIELPSIGCTLALANVYADVDFEEADL